MAPVSVQLIVDSLSTILNVAAAQPTDNPNDTEEPDGA